MVNIPQNNSITTILAMGDSFMDTGNNNHRQSLIKADFPPYGKDFLGRKSTGRFTNNRTLSDYIAGNLGVKEYLPAYLDTSIQDNDLISGVSFASGGSGYDNLTSKIVNVIPLSVQLEMFKEYIGKFKKIVGEEEANQMIKKGVYLVSSSSNDWAISYTAVPIRRLQYNVTGYAYLLANNARVFFEELYKLGARKIVVFGTPYIGCFPLARTFLGGLITCSDMLNKEAETFNKMLKSQLEYLQSSLPQSTFCYVDYFNISRELIVNHLQYGMHYIQYYFSTWKL
ncbi:GDSL esterase/lipase At5g42170 [Lactuca sativa]|uniref:GDSL esterase/lipase At5g42170 n=1 Tax=Lactuca sativa TaxID=4236 RepID=UPI0022AF98E7|nr:GDSL esterase/lipase At5g42170 [Lactuca sativa]